MKCHKCHKHPFLSIHVPLSWTQIPANEHKIAGCPQLVAALNDLGIDYKKKKNLTVRQARLIMEYLGAP